MNEKLDTSSETPEPPDQGPARTVYSICKIKERSIFIRLDGKWATNSETLKPEDWVLVDDDIN